MNRKFVFIVFAIVLIFLISIPFGPSTLVAQDATSEEEQEEEYDDEEDDEGGKPLVEGKFQVKQLIQSVNKEARINPDNETWDIQDARRTLHIYSQISDYLDEDKSFRWMFKAYGHSEYEPGEGNGEEEDLVRIDELFVDWASDDWFVNVGKRRITWGTTSAFNPLNVVVPPKNPLNPDPETEGHPLLLVNYAGDVVSFDLVLTRNYDRDWYGQYQRWGARLSFLFSDIDIGFYYFDGEAYENGSEYSRMAGASYSSNFLDDATLYMEVASYLKKYRVSFNEAGTPETKDESAVSGAVGSLITLDGNASVLLEIYHSGRGYTKEERENYFKTADQTLSIVRNESSLSAYQKWVLAQYQTWVMNQNYLLCSYTKSFWEKYNVGLTIIAADDASSFSTLSGSYAISDYYLFEMSYRQYFGDENSEFGNYYLTSLATLSLSSSF